MNYLVLSFAVLLASTCLALISKSEVKKRLFSCWGVFAGSIIGFIPCVIIFNGGSSFVATFSLPIQIFQFSFGLDPLSAFFLALIFLLSAFVGIYGWGYVKGQPRLISTLPFFPLLVLAMMAVVIARDGLTFLISWEVMSLSSFFLVTAEHESREVRFAGWVYLAATHMATAFLLALFVIFSEKAGSFSFASVAGASGFSPELAGLLFIFALIGFGTKAGIFPFHVWLPHAHPAAPSYISALMSAVMIKTGIYGILRILTFLGTPPVWWGEVMIVLGVLSAVIGAIFALTQHDIKKMLAYSSVENIGIISIGIGLGLFGVATGRPTVALLGLCGALFHVLNHALIKGILFLGAGNILHATHTRELDRMGGLLKVMPLTGLLMIGASAAISALPPFNIFLSEWVIYRGLFDNVLSLKGFSLFLSIIGIVGIAMAGGIIVAVFTKMVGVALLGEPRQEFHHLREVRKSQWISPLILGLIGLTVATAPFLVWPSIVSVAGEIYPSLEISAGNVVGGQLGLLGKIFLAFIIISAFGGFFWTWMVRRSGIRRAVTWDCGYAFPTPKMQYTALSFVQPLGEVFRAFLRPHVELKKPSGIFPNTGSLSESTEDTAERFCFRPVFVGLSGLFSFLKKMQGGRIQGYLALIFIVLLLLLIWEVWFGI